MLRLALTKLPQRRHVYTNLSFKFSSSCSLLPMTRRIRTKMKRSMCTSAVETKSDWNRFKDWMLQRCPPANWMHIFLLFTNGMGVVAFMFGLWTWGNQQEEKKVYSLRASFLKDLDRVNDQALNMNPELMLSNIKTYFTMLKTTEPHRTKLNRLVKKLKEQGGGVFARQEGLSTDEAKAAFKKFDRDGDGVVTMAEVEAFRKEASKNVAIDGEKEIAKLAGAGVTLDQIPMYAVANERQLLNLAATDYWLALRNSGDKKALKVERDRAILRSLMRKAKHCWDRNPNFESDPLMKQMLEEEPLTAQIAKEYIELVEPLMMAISRKDYGGAYYAVRRDDTFEFCETRYPEIRDVSKNPFEPYRAAEELVNMPKEGDRVLIIKSGSQYGNSAMVTDAHWFGRVKVEMPDGKFKSYLHTELEILETE